MKGQFTGSCLFLLELMRCQEDFSMPVSTLPGIGISCSTLLSVTESAETFRKASSWPAGHRESEACLERKPLGHSACVPPICQKMARDTLASVPGGSEDSFLYTMQAFETALSRQPRWRCRWVPVNNSGQHL